MKPTIILFAPGALTATWRETITSGTSSLLCGDLVLCAGHADEASSAVEGDGAKQLLILSLEMCVPSGIGLLRGQCPGLAVAIVEKSTGEKVKREFSYDGPPGTPKAARGPDAIRRTWTAGVARESHDWTERFRGLFEYAVVQDMSRGTGTSLYGAVERFLTSRLDLGLSQMSPAELRARRLMAIASRYRGQVPS